MRTKTTLTTEEFDNYPLEDDKRYELDQGELIELTRPAFRHNQIAEDLLVALKLYFRKHPGGIVLGSDIRLAPDVAVILGRQKSDLRNAKVIPVIPDLVCEVLPPSETPAAIHRKLNQYFTAGVKEAWLIDPESRTIEIWS